MTKQVKLTHIILLFGTISKLGDSDEAIKAYARAIEINPSESEAWSMMKQ